MYGEIARIMTNHKGTIMGLCTFGMWFS